MDGGTLLKDGEREWKSGMNPVYAKEDKCFV